VSQTASRCRRSRFAWAACAVVNCLAAVAGSIAADVPRKDAGDSARRGEKIYRQQCASCHGAAGEGTADNYPRALTGDRSLGQLAAFIEKSMPEDNPGTCIGDDAKSVAAYVYDGFYSPAARARNKPARVELARLTVNQHFNVLADLIGTIHGQPGPAGPRGLAAQYVARHRMGDQVRDDPPVRRIDGAIDFEFRGKGPLNGQIKTDEYEIHWHGALFAPETGEYEFNLETSNGARLWLNDNSRALIDAWVRSGVKTEHRESIRLLGGKKYPIRVEYVKGKTEAARIALKWRLPREAEEVVPARCFTASEAPEVFIVQTPFPPDDRSKGYEQGTSVSKEWEQAATDAAIEAAGYVGVHFRQLPGMAAESLGHDKNTRNFCEQFVQRALRRPLTPRDHDLYVDRRFHNAPDLETAVRRVVMLALASPRFLYISNSSEAFDKAARLSLVLWDSLPDQKLLEAAAAKQLDKPELTHAQAVRMLADPRARAKSRLFFLQWLKVETPPDLAKDVKTYNQFNASIAADLRTSLELFLDDVMWSEASDFRQLLTADAIYMNRRLADYYCQTVPLDDEFRKVAFEPEQRAGVLSHPYLMAAFAHTAASSPIHRGVFIARGVLGIALRPPPMAIAPLSPDLQPNLTTRQRVELQTRPDACQSCHATINPLGFALERFDASGRLRREENGQPINACGSYLTRDGKLIKFIGCRDLAQFLAASNEVHRAFVRQLFQFLTKQPVRAYGPTRLEDLTHTFVRHAYNMRALAAEIAVTAVQ
jgi:mono/diheme cytochrome c family protein